MDDVFKIALEIYAQAISQRMTSRGGKITDSKQLAQDAINFAIDFLEIASANHISERSLPAASSTMNRPVWPRPSA
jgi:glycerol-3-phosphate dehydrogenase